MAFNSSNKSSASVDFNSAQVKRYNHVRKVKDTVARYAIGVGGMGVIAAILLIFLYLMYEVVPLFQSAKVKQVSTFSIADYQRPSLYLAMDEQNEIALRLLEDGTINFINLDDGSLNHRYHLPIPDGKTITSFGVNSDESRVFIIGLNDGSSLIAKHEYKATYPNDVRVITPFISYPYGKDLISVDDNGQPLVAVSMKDNEDSLTIVAATKEGLFAKRLVKEEDFIMETVTLVSEPLTLPKVKRADGFVFKNLLIDTDQRYLYLQNAPDGFVAVGLNNATVEYKTLSSPLDSMVLLLGDLSLLTATESGDLSQWFMVRNDGSSQLTRIRQFEDAVKGSGLILSPEQRRKGFLIIDSKGDLALYNATANRQVFSRSLLENAKVERVALSPRADRLLIETQSGQLQLFTIKNKHPEVSFSALWSKVWYESYDEPKYVWQSSSSSNDFEPKMSLMPLSFGTLKAAFYAMLLGAPLAIFGAIYTAYFMTPVMRRKIKPLIELMEALPTVILGFLAGLWLAPFMEKNLAAIFTILLLLPIGIVAFAFGMSRLPMRVQNTINQGWHGFILIPIIILLVMFCLAISPMIELWLFNGNMRLWLSNDLGIPFDQRNALVVGVAMGFAVIPTIFSIAEDAIFSVPKHLSYGSLALGATPWQTLVGVVLPTASPGIFSGLMIGLGRAVGETMIVLMATGNTPIMDINIFEGMRTLAANLAVEMPETEVNSTHYRVLFLAAFVLFLFTFVVNTLAELVRQNLRKKYGSL